ncbi:glycosyltransferase family 4 protein [Bacteriovoracaceae bacterium]|nr:glycosyltransferase family 4 protein [Bacteriovoracaceae bacterium]
MKEKKHLLLFLTYGISLKKWKEMGILSRELMIYKKLQNEGYRISLISYGNKEDLNLSELDEFNVIPVYKYAPYFNSKIVRLLQSFFLWFWLTKIIGPYDLMKTNQMGGSWVCYLFKLFDQKPLVVRCGYELLWNHFREAKGFIRKYVLSAFFYLIELISYSVADKIILSNQSSIDFIHRNFPIDPENKCHLIRNFIDTDHFTEITPLEKSQNRILFIGRLNLVKNLSQLFLALKSIKIGLDIIGDGELNQQLKQEVEKEKIDVIFLGKINNKDLPQYINQYRYFCLPSLFENAPKSLMEAMSCGRIVLGTDTWGINELITPGKNGYLLPLGKGMGKSLNDVLQIGTEELKLVGKNARLTAQTWFAIDSIVQSEIKLYESLAFKGQK